MARHPSDQSQDPWESRVPDGPPGPLILRWLGLIVGEIIAPYWIGAAILLGIIALVVADTAGWI